MILAVDTSTAQASLALVEDADIAFEVSWRARSNHSQHVERMTRQAMDLTGIGPRDLSCVVVAVGPGSFSGVRVGLSFVKGLASVLNVPVAGVSTLDAIAYPVSALGPMVRVVQPAGRGQVYSAAYAGTGMAFRRTEDPSIMTLDEVRDTLHPGDIVAGEAREAVLEGVDHSSGIRLAPPVWSLRRAGFLAELGKRLVDAGTREDLNYLEPLYLRRTAAEEKRAATLQE
jgi:tRNA threonylcarbamoyladenosine biosynthesis protein TsaB